jgi:ubiquitin C-terminal hydrolase
MVRKGLHANPMDEHMLNVAKELFRSSMHQDAHEFLNFVLNTIAEDVSVYQKKNSASQKESTGSSNGSVQDSESEGPRLNGDTGSENDSVHTNGSQPATWVHQLFEGVFSNETRCLTCETVRFTRPRIVS